MNQPALAVVVFGCTVNADGSPSPALARRLQRAIQEWRRHPYGSVVVSGGARNKLPSEAQVMQQWLVQRGLPAERILMDEAARDTFENAKNTVPLLLGCQAQRVILVTEHFHMARAAMLLRSALNIAGLKTVRLERASARDALGSTAQVLRWLQEQAAALCDRYRLASLKSKQSS